MEEKKKTNKGIVLGLMIPSLLICAIARKNLEKKINIEFKCKIEVNKRRNRIL